MIKSDTAVITIPELDFEIPAVTQKGSLNTIEGFLQQSISALKSGQEERQVRVEVGGEEREGGEGREVALTGAVETLGSERVVQGSARTVRG